MHSPGIIRKAPLGSSRSHPSYSANVPAAATFPHVRLPSSGPRAAPVPPVHRIAGRRPGQRRAVRAGAERDRKSVGEG
ncbi:hypothetical protein G6F57_023252 [Rhizopus arrhizus]|nr:hypothetical protein G6F57_023252 [Rhizopus arrhizus]